MSTQKLENLEKDYKKALRERALNINYKLKLKGYSQADIARMCGFSNTIINAVLYGRTQSPNVEKKVKDAIEGVLEEKIF